MCSYVIAMEYILSVLSDKCNVFCLELQEVMTHYDHVGKSYKCYIQKKKKKKGFNSMFMYRYFNDNQTYF